MVPLSSVSPLLHTNWHIVNKRSLLVSRIEPFGSKHALFSNALGCRSFLCLFRPAQPVFANKQWLRTFSFMTRSLLLLLLLFQLSSMKTLSQYEATLDCSLAFENQ